MAPTPPVPQPATPAASDGAKPPAPPPAPAAAVPAPEDEGSGRAASAVPAEEVDLDEIVEKLNEIPEHRKDEEIEIKNELYGTGERPGPERQAELGIRL